MRVCVIGSGYVGLVTGACLADTGNHVICVDSDRAKIARLSEGQTTFFEPGLEELLRSNLKAQRLSFTTDIAAGVADARVIFLAVGTPPRADGSADLALIESAAQDAARALIAPAVVVVKSTVPVGTCRRVEELMRSTAKHAINVVSNPEFLKEGNAVDDFLRPDRVVIGAADPAAADRVAELYLPYVRNNKPILRMSREASELTKYAANAYLATRISFINEIADVCERYDVDIDEVRRGIGTDARIGHHFLYPGLGYGGSCFPKDVQALANFGKSAGASCAILEAVHARNNAQRQHMFVTILERFGGNLHGRKIAVWGVAFKPKTDDIREAPATTIMESLLSAGAKLTVHDPHAMANLRQQFANRVEYFEDAYAPVAGADALLICTEWNEFRNPDFERLRREMKAPLIFDGRNLYDCRVMLGYGFEYHSVGRPPVRPQ